MKSAAARAAAPSIGAAVLMGAAKALEVALDAAPPAAEVALDAAPPAAEVTEDAFEPLDDDIAPEEVSVPVLLAVEVSMPELPLDAPAAPVPVAEPVL